MTRAFTMLEVLLSLALLSVLAIVLAGTVRSATGTIPSATEPLRWQTAAEATLREIDRCIGARDRTTRFDRALVAEHRGLSILMPDGNRSLIYMDEGSLWRALHADDSGSSSRLLLGDIEAADWRLDPGNQRLGLTIEGPGDRRIERVWSLTP